MAGEIVVNVSVAANKAGTPVSNVGRAFNGVALDMAGDHFEAGIQDVTSTPAQVDLGSVATLGICVFRNTHATDTLLFRKGSGGADMVKARPNGGLAFFEAAANDIFVSSSSGTIKMERFLLEA